MSEPYTGITVNKINMFGTNEISHTFTLNVGQCIFNCCINVSPQESQGCNTINIMHDVINTGARKISDKIYTKIKSELINHLEYHHTIETDEMNCRFIIPEGDCAETQLPPDFTSSYYNTKDISKKENIRKSLELLKSKIGDDKYNNLITNGFWQEQGKEGIYKFYIDKEKSVTLTQIHKFGNKQREVEWTLCVQSSVKDLPIGDIVLARWLEWKVDEIKFLEACNFRNITTNDEYKERI